MRFVCFELLVKECLIVHCFSFDVWNGVRNVVIRNGVILCVELQDECLFTSNVILQLLLLHFILVLYVINMHWCRHHCRDHFHFGVLRRRDRVSRSFFPSYRSRRSVVDFCSSRLAYRILFAVPAQKFLDLANCISVINIEGWIVIYGCILDSLHIPVSFIN